MDRKNQFGYFKITIASESPRTLFKSNNERAFVLSFLQQALSMRTVLEGPLGYQSLAAHVDLLAFSLVRSSCQLVVFSISRQSMDVLCRRLCRELEEYMAAYGEVARLQLTVATTQLSGPHDALHQTTLLHKRHEDWEYDRYSSIGFYLHDRRGDWVRLWRLAQLYGCDSEKYRQMIESAPKLHTVNA